MKAITILVVIMTEYIVRHALKAITFHHLLLLKFAHAALFKGALQLKLITKPRLLVLK